MAPSQVQVRASQARGCPTTGSKATSTCINCGHAASTMPLHSGLTAHMHQRLDVLSRRTPIQRCSPATTAANALLAAHPIRQGALKHEQLFMSSSPLDIKPPNAAQCYSCRVILDQKNASGLNFPHPRKPTVPVPVPGLETKRNTPLYLSCQKRQASTLCGGTNHPPLC